MTEQAWGDNAVIVSDDGFNVHWKPKCPFCGYVPLNSEREDHARKGVGSVTYADCQRCGESFIVVLYRGYFPL